MEGENSWTSHSTENSVNNTVKFDSFSELNEDTNQEAAPISLDLILPDDLLERILSHLPIASIFRAGCVCKRWHEIVTTKRFLTNTSKVQSRKPWYFMFTSSDEPIGYSYDPVFRKWYPIELPFIENSNWSIASSGGLVCFTGRDIGSELYICNPITKQVKWINGPTGPKFSDYSALAVSVDRGSHKYQISIVKSMEVSGSFFEWDVSIHLYDSVEMTWTAALTEGLTGWRGGGESVICGGVLYFLVYSTGGGGGPGHRLVMYDLKSGSVNGGSLMGGFVGVPCALTCGRLMNLKEKLVMVGGIGKNDRTDIIKGIGIWVLDGGREWQEITRMPHRFFQGFGEFDDVFASSGTDDLVYIQSYGGPALLVFDFGSKQWKWSQKCPVAKRFPLQLFTGFCFEPRLEIAP
ncbi:hypothetical protein ACP275_14G145300 [Erythranthe tilingii]